MLFDGDQIWWIVPPGQQMRHAITEHPGAWPAGETVTALCSTPVKLPHDTWPLSREPASLGVTRRCSECAEELGARKRRDERIKVSNWDS